LQKQAFESPTEIASSRESAAFKSTISRVTRQVSRNGFVSNLGVASQESFSRMGNSAMLKPRQRVFGTLPGQFNPTLARKDVIRFLLIPSRRKILLPLAMTMKISEQ